MSTVAPNDSLSFVNGTLTVIASSGIGAALNDNIAYPSGAFSGQHFPMINVKSNSIVTLAGDCATDDTANLSILLGWGRDIRSTTVNVSGAAVTATSGTSFTGVVPGPAQIGGINVTIQSVTDSTHLTLAGSPGTMTGAKMHFMPNLVSTDATSSSITAVNGLTFSGLSTSGTASIVVVAGYTYQITSINSATNITVASYDGSPALPTLTGVYMYAGSPSSGWGRQHLNLYFPTGCYLVTSQLVVYGTYFTLRGDGPHSSYIRLAPNAPSANRGSTKSYLLETYSNASNQNFREFIQDMGFAAGPGNPNVELVHWYNNNMGAINNVQLWCEDSACLYGLGLESAYPGPTLIKNLAIYGCQYGVQFTGQAEYSTTIEGLTTEGQSVMAIGNAQNHFSIRHWLSVGSEPALIATGSGSSIAILDSSIIGPGAGTVTGITNGASGSVIYGKALSCSGYSTCGMDSGSGSLRTYATFPSEFWTGTAQSVFDSNQPAHNLGLAVSETPSNPDPCTPSRCDWQQLGSDPTTWAATIASPTSTSLYLPPGTYDTAANPVVTVPDSVNYIDFNSAQFSLANQTANVTLNVAGTSSTPLMICGCMYQNCLLNHTGTRTVVLKDWTGGYQAQQGTGNLYLEDAVLANYPKLNNGGDGPTFYSSQSIWARQLNIETGTTSGTIYPKFTCNGAKVWILGYKTEQDSPSVVENQGCIAEIYGFFFYQLSQNPAPVNSAPISLTNSSIWAVGGFIFVNSAGYGAPRWINETRGNSSSWIASPSVDVSLKMNALHSYGGSALLPPSFGNYSYFNPPCCWTR
jgi:hypothetical protein